MTGLPDLPVEARQKLQALESVRDDARALLLVNVQRARRAEDRIAAIREQADSASDAMAIEEAQKEISLLRDELERLDRDRATRKALYDNTEQVLAQLKAHFIPMLPPQRGVLRAMVVSAVPEEGESLTGAVVRVRRQIMEAGSTVQRLRNAPPPREELVAQAKAYVASMAERGAPLVEPKPIGLSVLWDRFGIHSYGTANPHETAAAMLAALLPDQMLELVIANIPPAVIEPVATEARPGLVREAECELLRLERIEEALVVQAHNAGLEVHRRWQASGYALLALAHPELDRDSEAAEAA